MQADTRQASLNGKFRQATTQSIWLIVFAFRSAEHQIVISRVRAETSTITVPLLAIFLQNP